jgi:hypothetical protein
MSINLLFLILFSVVLNKQENRRQFQYRVLQNTFKELNTKKTHKLLDFLPFNRDHELEKSDIIELISQLEYYNIYTLVIFTTFTVFDNGSTIQFNDNKQHLFSLNLTQIDRAERLIILYSGKNKYFKVVSNPMVMGYFNTTRGDESLIDELKENPYHYIRIILDGLYKHVLPKARDDYDLSIKSLFIIPVLILLCVGKCCFSKKTRKDRKLKLLKEKIQKLVIDMDKFDSEVLKDKSCVICFRDFTEGSSVQNAGSEDVVLIAKISKDMDRHLIVGLKCEHYFHYACIFNWFKNKKSCPTCRQDVSDYIVL